MPSLPPQLEIHSTGDGSPTIAYKRADGYVEKMHHSGGAFLESVYIYHHGLAMALKAGLPAYVISLGLGLGYNEMIAVGEFLKRDLAEWKIWSFEADPFLREEFLRWIAGKPAALATVYDQIANLVCRHFAIEISEFKKLMAEGLRDGRLSLRGTFPEDAGGVTGAGIFFYDAFSKKMSPELWRENEMRATLEAALASQTLLCTYAATGALNRVLKSLGFRLLDRPGFQGKRESTLAIRE